MASPARDAPFLEPGFRLDRYELLCRIGQGGMATVWMARTNNSRGEERLVAIKTVLPSLASDERLRTMLMDEARIAISIEHPNVARTLAVGELWDMPYLVLELIEGESVDQLCKALADDDRDVPPAMVARIVADAARGLHAAHEVVDEATGTNLGIVHRDVAPPNILLDEQGRARVIDFGVAKAIERVAPDTTAGVMKGRVPYMAPEHASGDPVDRRSDIWSLGVVAYVMLTRRFPFEAPNEAARLIRILGTDEPDPMPDHVPAPLRDVVMRALSKDPDLRPSTAADFARELEGAIPAATHDEVVAFVNETLAVAIADRHELLQNALAAADGRERARELLDKPLGGSTGNTTGNSHSVRPPPSTLSALTDDDPSGTLGSVTRHRRASSRERRARPWTTLMTASLAFVLVIGAFALGAFRGRNEAAEEALAITSITTPPTTLSGADEKGAQPSGAKAPATTSPPLIVPAASATHAPSATPSATSATRVIDGWMKAADAATDAPPPPPKPVSSSDDTIF